MDKCHDLLMGLKCTVERLLAVQASNVWSTYGGFKRVSSQMEAILNHRIKSTQMFSPSDGVFWPFVCGLKWLRPGISSTMEQVSRGSRSGGQVGKGQLWLRESLQEHSLSSQLEILVSDLEHLHYHYQDGAFLRRQDYVEAMLLCLRALELNKVVILSDINPKLLKRHRQDTGMNSSCGPSPGNVHQDRNSVGFEPGSLSQPASTCSSWIGAEVATSPPKISVANRLSEPSVVTAYQVRSDFQPVSGDTTPSSAAQHSLSTSPTPTASSSPSTLTSTSPMLYRLQEWVNSDPLMVATYGSLPSYRVDTPVFHMSEEEFSSSTERDPVVKGPLRKCMSASSANPAADISDVNNFHGLQSQQHQEAKTAAKVVQKKIHFPEQDNVDGVQRSNKYDTWHGGQGMARRNSEAKSSSTVVASTSKQGHKRSQSDMGVGAASVRGFSTVQEHGQHGDVSGSSLVMSPMEAGASSEMEKNTTQRYNKVSLHRGDSLFQPPAKGQSLVSYLSEQDFNCCALLERENAHFAIADVLISVFEQMKWETSLRRQSQLENISDEDESDDEIYELKQRIRIRRRERLVEKSRRFPANSDGMNDTNTTSSLSASSPLSSQGFSSLSDNSEHSDDMDEQIELTYSGNETSNLALLNSSGLSLSMASLYSDADLQRNNKMAENKGLERQSLEKSNFSAEAIALSLLSQFSEKRLPKASELDWLVSEKDAPQALLPLPNSYPISPDDGENADLLQTASQTKLRGNLEWAPPRQQIIFTVHSQENRQNMRCAGCGTKTEPGFVKRLRYCEYMGKYFCQCCHSNDTEVIPGRVIMRWDFSRYYVSNFARDLLQKIHQQPLFHIDAINHALYRKVRTMESIRDLRRQLGHLNFLLNVCKRDRRLLEEIEKLPKHWWEDDNLYSMDDFNMVRSGQMLASLKSVVFDSINHVVDCQLCHGLGFICEVCQDPSAIFPFQLSKVARCPVCQACYHRSCFIPGKCPKCSRMEIRRRRQSHVTLGATEQC